MSWINLLLTLRCWFIHGNHDSKTISALIQFGIQGGNHAICNHVVDIQGTHIAGLGGVFHWANLDATQSPPCFDPVIIANIAHRREDLADVCLCVIARQFSIRY